LKGAHQVEVNGISHMTSNCNKGGRVAMSGAGNNEYGNNEFSEIIK